jgi:hypothetical protein
MPARPMPSNPDFVKAVQGLHALHALASANDDQGPEADLVRDHMDGPYYALSETEKQRVNGLSGDLYSISNPPRPPLPMNPQAQRGLEEALAAYHDGKWDEALALLRLWSQYLDPAELSRRRGAVWKGAGDEATAGLFFEHAASVQAGQPEVDGISVRDR